MSKLSGPATARWYDPTNGVFTEISGLPFANTGTQSFTTPGSNSSGDPDWVLVVEVAGDGTVPVIPPTISALSLPGGQLGVGYNASLGVTGGQSPYTVTLSSGAFPNGLSLVGQNIVGTPMGFGKKSFTIRVTDQLGAAVSRRYTLNIVKAIGISTASLKSASAGKNYSATLKGTNGQKPYSWSVVSGTLPEGLVFDSSTGKISGVPISAGSSLLTFQVSDPLGGTAQKALMLTIK
jgi:hypothetical protein